MTEYKVLSINPGARERIPAFTREITQPQSIVPFADRLAHMFGGESSLYLRGSGSRLMLRVISALVVGCCAFLQMQGQMCVLGIESGAYFWGVVAIILSVMMLLGVAGRISALALTTLSVAALVNYAYANGGVADFSATCQLSLIYGALTASVAVLGTGRFTLLGWLCGRLGKHS